MKASRSCSQAARSPQSRSKSGSVVGYGHRPSPWRTLPLPNPKLPPSSPCHAPQLPLPQAGASHRPWDCWAASGIWPRPSGSSIQRSDHSFTPCGVTWATNGKTGALQPPPDPRPLEWMSPFCRQQWRHSSSVTGKQLSNLLSAS